MPDMLVRLYDFKLENAIFDKLKESGIEIRRAMAPDKRKIADWVHKSFGDGWASECEVAFSNSPISCFIAVKNTEIIGFACYEATARDFFGPTGVAEEARGSGVGTALLLSSMHAMKEMGYAYAIIGGAGPVEYYRKVLNATCIDGSEPGIYRNMLHYRDAAGN
jgi:GNAT superfamily N-acetyltransferase